MGGPAGLVPVSDTLIGSIWGGVVVLVGGLLTWLAARGKTKTDSAATSAQLQEQKRQADINLIIVTLQGQVEDLQATVKEQHQAMKEQQQSMRAVQQENRECLDDRDRMRGELRQLTRRLGQLEKGGGDVGE